MLTQIKYYEVFTKKQLAMMSPHFTQIAQVICPECGCIMSINKEIHRIMPDGRLSPSLVCPHCPFHKFAQLKDYPHRSIHELTKVKPEDYDKRVGISEGSLQRDKQTP